MQETAPAAVVWVCPTSLRGAGTTWCTVIGFVLGVWVVSSKPRSALTRWTLNWWATRSRSNTEKRIQKLQTALAKTESLTILTEFEDTVLRGLSGIILFLCVIALLALLGFATLSTNLSAATPTGFLHQSFLFLFALLVGLIGIGIAKYLDNFRLPRSLAYRETVQKNIEELQARLR